MPKKFANPDFNMSEAIRDVLLANPKLSCKEATDAILELHPSAKINKNSFSVAFYTGRNKLGISSSGRGRGRKPGFKVVKTTHQPSVKHASVNLAMLQTTAKFLSEVGGAEAAIEAIKQVQAVQVK